MTEQLSGTVEASRLDLAGIYSQDQGAAYQAQLLNTLDTEFLTPDISVGLCTCFFGELHIARCVATARRTDRTPALIAADGLDAVAMQLAIAGRSRGEANGRTVVSDPGTIMILDFRQPFYMIDLEERDVVNVGIPRHLLARHVPDADALHGVVLDRDRASVLTAVLTELAPRIDRLPAYSGPVLADTLLDLFLLALGCDPRALPLPQNKRTVILEKARQLVDANLCEGNLTPEWLGGKLGLSRTELYRLFEVSGGVSRYIWRRRLEAAHAALQNPQDDRRNSEIAFNYGFSSEAHFSRAFRKAFGRTASDVRRERLIEHSVQLAKPTN